MNQQTKLFLENEKLKRQLEVAKKALDKFSKTPSNKLISQNSEVCIYDISQDKCWQMVNPNIARQALKEIGDV